MPGKSLAILSPVRPKRVPVWSGKKRLWLALLNEYPLVNTQEYKDVLSQFSTKHPFEKIVLVSRDGTVSELGPEAS